MYITQLAKMSIDPEFIELTPDVFWKFSVQAVIKICVFSSPSRVDVIKWLNLVLFVYIGYNGELQVVKKIDANGQAGGVVNEPYMRKT